jgi:hypothetical protein
VNYDEFFAMAESRGLRVEFGESAPESIVLLSNEALFQLPLLAMVIMIRKDIASRCQKSWGNLLVSVSKGL